MLPTSPSSASTTCHCAQQCPGRGASRQVQTASSQHGRCQATSSARSWPWAGCHRCKYCTPDLVHTLWGKPLLMPADAVADGEGQPEKQEGATDTERYTLVPSSLPLRTLCEDGMDGPLMVLQSTGQLGFVPNWPPRTPASGAGGRARLPVGGHPTRLLGGSAGPHGGASPVQLRGRAHRPHAQQGLAPILP